MLQRIQHETRLNYSLPVSETVFEVRMAPPSDDDQTSLSYQLKTTPQAPVTSYRDGYGNRVDLFNVTTPYKDLIVSATSYVRTHRRSPADRLMSADAVWKGRPATGPDAPHPGEDLAVEALEFLQASPLIPQGPELDGFVDGIHVSPGSLAPTLVTLMKAVNSRLKYEAAVTRVRTPVGEALRLGRGVCQDFSHLFIGACRGLGLPARYVSGYFNHPGEIATHAWCQVWGGERVGWVDVDPTHDTFVNNNYVVTACGRDYHDVPPNRGLWKGRAEETIGVTVTVEPVDRVPLEWNDWNAPTFRPAGQGQYQYQRQGPNGRPSTRNRTAYPQQSGQRPGLINQQSEQQQQSD